METVTVVRSGERLYVTSPYLPAMIKRARGLGGEFLDGRWVFALRHEVQVRGMLVDCFGTDGTPTSLVTVRFPYESDVLQETSRGSYTAFGRLVARATGRDSGARIGPGVLILSGGFNSGGSMKNWTITNKEGTRIEMVDVPETLAMKAKLEDEDIEIIRPATVDRAALEDEAARLTKRLAEIAELLK